jgi:hypothetical protein
LSKEETRLLASGNEEMFESKIKNGLMAYKKTRLMDQLFALIEEVVEDHEVGYRAYVPVK